MVEENQHTRAMVVVAHPDDAEFGCSGTVARWCREGVEVVYVLCTNGDKGSSDPEMTPERLAPVRKKEQRAAGAVLGLKEVAFLGYPDGYLQPTLELRRDIAREIRRHRPDVLVCQSALRSLTGRGYLGHPDHFAAAEAALSAVYPAARDRLTFPELLAEGLKPHNVREVLVMGHDTPDYWVDVTDSLETAIRALQEHKSQIRDREIGERMRQWRREAGEAHGMQYAEAFRRIVIR